MRIGYEHEEQDAEADQEVKSRQCLICAEHFTSHWAGERVCRKCKSSATWRQG